MALKYRKVQRKVLLGQDQGKVKTYATAKSSGYCDMEKLCDLIANRSAMSSGDVKSILDSLNWAMGLELRSGNIVQVGEFGNFHLTVSSEGGEDEKKFKASNIKKARIVFSPGRNLRFARDRVSFEEEDLKEVEVDAPESEKPDEI